MRPSEVRGHVLQDHEGLRRDLDRLEERAKQTRREDPVSHLPSLLGDAETLLEKLQVHMRWEEVHLLPVLRDADAWGEERALRLERDHREQRALLDFILERLHDTERPNELLYSDVFGLIAFLREDMEEEERDLLDERVLRDDVIAIEMEAG